MNSFGFLPYRYVSYILAQYFTQLSFDGLCSKFVYILSILVFDLCLASAQKNIFYTMYALHATKTSQTGRLVLVFSVHNYNHLHSFLWLGSIACKK